MEKMEKMKEEEVERLIFFSFLSNYKGAPSPTQGNGWGDISPWHKQHNKLVTTPTTQQANNKTKEGKW